MSKAAYESLNDFYADMAVQREPDPVLIARVCHEANRMLCLQLGDASQVRWDDAPSWQQDSAVLGVKAVLNNPNITPAMLHAGWLEQKRADGWEYGPVKDVASKTHPCCVPYEMLPPEQRFKDTLFKTMVEAFL
jgi:hypothetical protein